MQDDLDYRLEQHEARLREVRRLLAQQKHRRASAPEKIQILLAQFLEVSGETDALAETLCRMLRADSEKRTRALRACQYEALTTGVETSRLPWVPDSDNGEPNFGRDKYFGKDEDEAAGNAPVPAFPKRPVPVLSGGAARRFEESDEPPRNP